MATESNYDKKKYTQREVLKNYASGLNVKKKGEFNWRSRITT